MLFRCSLKSSPSGGTTSLASCLTRWRAQLSLFLGIDPREIGQIGGGKRSANGRLDVAMIQSLVREGRVADSVSGYGQVIVDECHHVPVLLTERRDHLEHLAERLRKFARHVVVLHGGMGARSRRAALAQLAAIPADEERLVLATGRYAGEGFDDSRLDTLFLALPISWRGTLEQYAGRLHRLHLGKTEVRIFDYVDRQVPVLLRMFGRRLRGYRSIGYARGEAPLGLAEDAGEVSVEADSTKAVSAEDDLSD